MRILYVFDGKDVNDKHLWSGTTNRIYKAIKEDYEVIPYSNRNIYFYVSKIIRKIFKRNFLLCNYLDKKIARKIDKVVNKKNIDALFFIIYNSPISYLKTNKKKIYLTDATVHLLHDYYHHFSNLEYKYLNELQQKAINNSVVITCSNWAKQDMIDYYGANENNIFVLPLFTDIKENKKESYRAQKIINVLFSGVDFNRKGEDIFINVAKECEKENLPYQFTMIGINQPIETSSRKNVNNLGFIDRNNPLEEKRMEEIYSHSDIFFLPTRAEAAGIVFSEAAHFGIPVISHNTGGVPTYVKHNYNGLLLDIDSPVDDYINALKNVSNNYEFYSNNAYKYDEQVLNINNWKENFKKIIFNNLNN